MPDLPLDDFEDDDCIESQESDLLLWRGCDGKGCEIWEWEVDVWLVVGVSIYLLVMTSSLLTMAIEIVNFPVKDC